MIMSFFYVLLKTLKIVIGPNFWPVLYINKTLSEVIFFFCLMKIVVIIILLFYLI